MKRNKKFYQEKKFRKQYKELLNNKETYYIEDTENYIYTGLEIDERYCPSTQRELAEHLLKLITLKTPYSYSYGQRCDQFLGYNVQTLIKVGFTVVSYTSNFKYFDDEFLNKYFHTEQRYMLGDSTNNWTSGVYDVILPLFPMTWFKYNNIIKTKMVNNRIKTKQFFNWEKWDKVIYHDTISYKLYWKNRKKYWRNEMFWFGYDRYLDKKLNTPRYAVNRIQQQLNEDADDWDDRYDDEIAWRNGYYDNE